MTDNLRDKIISLTQARTAKDEAIIDAAVETEIRSSEQFNAVLTDALMNWLNTTRHFNDDDDFAEIFYWEASISFRL
jgi:hypothetical protein